MPALLDRIRNGEIDTTSLITHRLTLEDAPHGYDIFKNKEDECVKVVMRPN
jgi:threonine dehydrogenase-like Zn-dependent dehydrogenase